MQFQVGDELSAAVLPEDVAAVETWRQRVDGAIVRAVNHGDVVTQTCRQFHTGMAPRLDRHLLLRIERQVVQRGKLVVAELTPGGCIAHIVIVGAATIVATARVLSAHHHTTHQTAEAVCPVALQT